MTTLQCEKQKTRANLQSVLIIIATSAVILITLIASAEIRSYIISGIRLCAFSVIPAIFPFLILSDFMITVRSEKSGLLSKAFEHVFKISSAALPALICGFVCGFPVGIKIATDLYGNNDISKTECEKLIGFSSNPSIAFVISGIGIGIYSNIKYGIIIYISIIISSISVGILFRSRSEINTYSKNKPRQMFNIVNSIKNSALSCIFISSYIIFFSAAIGIVAKFIKNGTALALLTMFLEITTAAKSLSSLTALPVNLKLSLTAFALSFSGICIAMQARSILPDNISMKEYYKMKILIAALSFIITYLTLSII